MSFATPHSSPSRPTALKSMDSSFCDSPPLKQQRLFSPSPGTPTKTLPPFRHIGASLSHAQSPLRDSTNTSGDDVMMCSPPKIERLQLFDSPQTPMSIAKNSGLLPSQSVINR